MFYLPLRSCGSPQAAVDLDLVGCYFRLASNAVDAGAKARFSRVGLLGDQDGILAGLSNVGLDECGRLAALSLAEITAVLLMLHANTDSLVLSRFLLTLSAKVEKQFANIKRRERQLQASVGR